jgi:hypothetical protein
MMDWPRPHNKKTMQSFLGIVNFFRRFIRNVSEKTEVFRKLIVDNERYDWNDELEQYYKVLYDDLITNGPFLAFPVPGVKIELATDASDHAIGAALYQTINGERMYLGFHSRSLTKSERNYSIPKKELLSVVYHIAYYRYYLLGVKFYLHVDNKAIALALDVVNKISSSRNRTIIGWISTLSEYEYDVFHIPGSENTLPDLTSRLYKIRKVTTVRATKSTPNKEEEVAKRIPEERIEEILSEAHELGHFGSNAMYKHITISREITGIPYLLKRCVRFVRKCDVCRKVNTHRVGYSPLSTPKILQPHSVVHCDVMDMSKSPSRSGYRYVLCMVDKFTRFVWLVPSTTKKASSIANHMVSVFTAFGFPKYIKTDMGKEYINELIENLAKIGGFKRNYVLPYNHHANGIVERNMKTIRDTLLKYASSPGANKDDWDLYVGITMLALNTRVVEETRSTPFALMFGRLPFALGRDETEVGPSLEDEGALEDAVQHYKEFWITFKRNVVPHIQSIREARYNKKKYRKKTSEFKVGDHVMYQVPNKISKYQLSNIGPFQVTEVLDNAMYRIEARNGYIIAPTNFLRRTELKRGEQLYNGSIEELDNIETEANEDVEDERRTIEEEVNEEGIDDHKDEDFLDFDPDISTAKERTPIRTRQTTHQEPPVVAHIPTKIVSRKNRNKKPKRRRSASTLIDETSNNTNAGEVFLQPKKRFKKN